MSPIAYSAPMEDTSNDTLKLESSLPPRSQTNKYRTDKTGMEAERDRQVQLALEDAARRVREQSDRFQKAVMPIAESLKILADAKPVLFTFLVIFIALSFVPIVCFAGFVLASTMFILGGAAIGICLCVAGTILLGAALVLPAIIVSALLAGAALVGLLALFLGHRLYLHLVKAIPAGDRVTLEHAARGVRAWADETRGRVVPEEKYKFTSRPVVTELDVTNSKASDTTLADAAINDRSEVSDTGVKVETNDTISDDESKAVKYEEVLTSDSPSDNNVVPQPEQMN